MTRHLISTGSPFEKVAGYSRAVIVGDMCFVAGTTGYDYTTMVLPESVEDQTHNCFKTITETLEKAGFSINEVVRAVYYVTEIAYADRVFPIFGTYFAHARPAATIVGVTGLYKPEMKIEIEVTAKKA
ncbi:enamine/imine deaminase [Variibacter gotjawalensis]|uniref:Enamine/imine deaminase n=1 Tax=Variibacter gotjawalensis TaxID=1333996 RepID=A0A0S3PS91_9BRAD|nr:RidA family protein [Variibacter gotjawalensis]NIK49030.1 enamine deaminase RidA (YjgF/YER057c/UK114 family) [Variibacter gotjawalensis]RZS50886.1 enamine deaminase RidA (YjgF/YER057c/UK114 family) [Variibacter gotjawalensis]BAT58720.1 enamine/imine deaminase [Variibacter gotjawalensis]